MSENGSYVDMALRRIVLRDQYENQTIYLCESDGERAFAISIGRGEAEEIRRVVSREETARPLTHQLLFETLQAAGGELVAVEVNDLRQNTFFARLVLRIPTSGEERRVDARSSDAIALALRAGCPIRVAESVLEQVRIDLAPDVLPPPEDPAIGDPGTDPQAGDEAQPDPDDSENLEEGGPAGQDPQ